MKSREPAIQRSAWRSCNRRDAFLMEDAPFIPLYTLAEIYGVARNVVWNAAAR